MPIRSLTRALTALLLCVLLAACAATQPPSTVCPTPPSGNATAGEGGNATAEAPCPPAPLAEAPAGGATVPEMELPQPEPSELPANLAGLPSNKCYSYKPARQTTRTVKGKKSKQEKVVVSWSLCQPQCIPYARCRSAIESCKLGNTGPVTWFQCEEKAGDTSPEPAQGSILILGKNAHGMPTGHGLYVEKLERTSDHTWRLTLSHTNYDRKCAIETNVLADYDKKKKTLDMVSGAWKAWGRDLKVMGFILR